MSERATETVVVDDANAARALIGRKINGRTVQHHAGRARTFILCDLWENVLGSGDYGDPKGVEVDALPPVTEWVHLDDVKDRKLPGETRPVHGVGTFNGDWIWWPLGEDWRTSVRPLTVVDHMVEVLAETPPPEPDTVSVRDAAKALLKALDGVTFTPASLDREMDGLRAALAAEGDEN